jgi:hypothetical protein
MVKKRKSTWKNGSTSKSVKPNRVLLDKVRHPINKVRPLFKGVKAPIDKIPDII